MTRLLTSWWLLAILIIIACLYAVSVDAGERRTLEDVNRDINRYWAQQRFEAYQREDQRLQEQQLETLREIEQNTRDR